jgi:hypothetical protein
MVSARTWYEALASEYGVVVDTDGDPIRAREKLELIRAELDDKDLRSIEIVLQGAEIWLVKRNSNAS